jgi:hypothetical protein
MKIELQEHEPRQRVFGDAEVRNTAPMRKRRVRFTLPANDLRLFHAL